VRSNFLFLIIFSYTNKISSFLVNRLMVFKFFTARSFLGIGAVQYLHIRRTTAKKFVLRFIALLKKGHKHQHSAGKPNTNLNCPNSKNEV
jgi:hypothetical protein